MALLSDGQPASVSPDPEFLPGVVWAVSETKPLLLCGEESGGGSDPIKTEFIRPAEKYLIETAASPSHSFPH